MWQRKQWKVVQIPGLLSPMWENRMDGMPGPWLWHALAVAIAAIYGVKTSGWKNFFLCFSISLCDSVFQLNKIYF